MRSRLTKFPVAREGVDQASQIVSKFNEEHLPVGAKGQTYSSYNRGNRMAKILEDSRCDFLSSMLPVCPFRPHLP